MNLRRTTLGLAVLGIGLGVAPGCGITERNFSGDDGDAGEGGSRPSAGAAGKASHSAGAGGSAAATEHGAAGTDTEGGAKDTEGGSAGADAGAPGDGGTPGDGGAGGVTANGGAGGGNGGTGGTGGTGGGAVNGGTGGSAPVAPETRLTSTPPNPDRLTSSTFQFSSTIANSTFQCKIDSGNYATCASPRAVTIAGEGPHTFSVYASAGGVDDPTPATYTWTLDTVVPTLQISATPAAVTSASTASFAFTAEAGATLACRVDAAAFGACTSATTHNLTGLAVGNHTFEVRATDAANNQKVQSYTWYIEPPCTGVLIETESLLPAMGWGLASGSVLHNSQAIEDSGINSPLSFSFQGKGLVVYYRKGPVAGKHSVSIDGGTAVTITATDANGWSYQQPSTVATGLANAVHTATLTCLVSDCQIDYFAVTCL